MSSGLIDTIKRASLGGYESTSPLKLIFGEVVSTSPVKVKVSTDLTLTEEFLAINGTIAAGDKVPMIRVQGGQKYVVIGSKTSVVDETKYITIIGGDEASET